MILTKLKEYADRRMELPPTMYGEGFVRWLVDIDSEGNLLGFISLGGDKKNKFGVSMTTPQVPPVGSGIKPRLLIDTGERVFGIPKTKPKPSNPERVKLYHQKFKEKIHSCAEETQEASVQAVLKFLESWNPEEDSSKLPSDFTPEHVVTFRVKTQDKEIIPADARSELHNVENFWATHAFSDNQEQEEDTQDASIMQCLVTGDVSAVAQRMPVPIKGIPGKRAELALVSANQKVFTSYGLENSLTSPISYKAGEYFAKALNYLIADEQSRLYMGSTVYVFWTREKTEFNPLNLLKQPKPEQVETLFKSVFTGQQASSLDDSKVKQFYALSLTANNARAVVRDWLETTIPNVQQNLKAWFQHQQLVDPYGAASRPLSVYLLAESLYRDRDAARKEMQPTVTNALIRKALHGDRLPEELLAKLVRRNRTEQDITYPRAVLLKLMFSSHPTRKEMMVNMEQLNPDPNLQGNDLSAYACGRLLAVLESIQRSAIGSVNAALTDRYYGAASSTPAIAFPPLLKGARSHLAKLRNDPKKRGAYRALEERLEDVMTDLPTFPKTLSLQQQGLFGLGYYHQRASDRAAAKAKSKANSEANSEEANQLEQASPEA